MTWLADHWREIVLAWLLAGFFIAVTVGAVIARISREDAERDALEDRLFRGPHL